MTERLKVALDLCEKKLPLTLCRPGEKAPLGHDWSKNSRGKRWQTKTWTKAEIKRAFTDLGDCNVGLRWGPDSGFIDIETDGPEGGRWLNELFDNDVPVTAKFSSKRGYHLIFKWDDRLAATHKANICYGGPGGVDIRLGAKGGSHSLLPPSITGGCERAWMPGLSLDECPPAALPDAVIEKLLRASKGGDTADTEYTDTQTLKPSVSAVSSLSTKDAVERAIAVTVPSAEGWRERQLFNFARRLKAIPKAAAADMATLKEVVRRWHKTALPNISTKDFDTSWRDFRRAWARVKYPYGQGGKLADAFDASQNTPLPAAADAYDSPVLKQLIGLCSELQRRGGEKPFFLSCRDVDGLLGITYKEANKWLNHLVEEGVLMLVTKGYLGRASEYRYIADHPPAP